MFLSFGLCLGQGVTEKYFIGKKLNMGLLDLFTTSSISIVKLLLVIILGSFLALDCVDILGEDARKHLNRVVFYVFNPALAATSLAKTMTYERMLTLWFMPLNILLTYIIGSALGWIVIKITRPPSHLKSLIFGSCSAGNLGNLLFVVVPELCKQKGSPFGEPDVCNNNGLAYAAVSTAGNAVCLWIYVYNIIRISVRDSNNEVEVDVCINTTESSAHASEYDQRYIVALLQQEDCLNSESYAETCALPFENSADIAKVPISIWFEQHVKMLTNCFNLKRLIPPATIGAITGLLVGTVPGIRKLVIGESAPLRVIQDSASLIGDAAIPAIILILGANLMRGLKGSEIRRSFIIGIIVVKYILLPLSGFLVVKAAHHFGFVRPDPLYQFILMLQFAVPPATNIGTITQLFGAGESECSVIMLWTYALASVSLTLWSTFFMWLVS